MTIYVVANPTAGGGRAGRILPRLIDRIKRTFPGVPVSVRSATSVDDARAAVNLAVHRSQENSSVTGADALVVIGGDGMIHLGLNAVAGTEIGLCLIPAGSGNDLCRGLQIPIGDEPKAIDALAGTAEPIDLLRLTPATVGRRQTSAQPVWVGSIVASGFDARVNLRANTMTFPKGRAQYPAAVAAELRTFAPIQYRLVIDGQERELPAMLVAVGNTTTYGGGLAMCPEAVPTDGLLDITIVHPVPRRTLVRLFPRVYSGTFVEMAEVELIRARSVRLEGTLADGTELTVMGDGEELGTGAYQVDCVAGAAHIYRGRCD